jgi:hypothetical protein
MKMHDDHAIHVIWEKAAQLKSPEAELIVELCQALLESGPPARNGLKKAWRQHQKECQSKRREKTK